MTVKSSSHWDKLRLELIRAAANRGAKSALAKSLGVTRSAVTQWLSKGGTTPTAEMALRLDAWVHPDKGKKGAPAVYHHDRSQRPKSANQVMKNKLKSAKSSSKAAAASQPKTKASKKKAASKPRIGGLVTYILLESNGRELARVGFPRAVSAHIQRAARKLKISLPQLFGNAIHHHIERLAHRRSA